jgi:hypothetical protein
MPGPGWRKNLKGGTKGSFLNFFSNIKGFPLIYQNNVPIFVD